MFRKIRSLLNRSVIRDDPQTDAVNTNEQFTLTGLVTASTIESQRTDQNEDDITIIWLTINTENTEVHPLIKSLRSISNGIKVSLNKPDRAKMKR